MEPFEPLKVSTLRCDWEVKSRKTKLRFFQPTMAIPNSRQCLKGKECMYRCTFFLSNLLNQLTINPQLNTNAVQQWYLDLLSGLDKLSGRDIILYLTLNPGCNFAGLGQCKSLSCPPHVGGSGKSITWVLSKQAWRFKKSIEICTIKTSFRSWSTAWNRHSKVVGMTRLHIVHLSHYVIAQARRQENSCYTLHGARRKRLIGTSKWIAKGFDSWFLILNLTARLD